MSIREPGESESAHVTFGITPSRIPHACGGEPAGGSGLSTKLLVRVSIKVGS